MVHTLMIHRSGYPDSASPSNRRALLPVHARKTLWTALTALTALFALLLAPSPSAHAATNYIPPVVVSSVSSVPSSGLGTPGGVALDACSNIYEFDSNGNIMEIPAGGGAATKVTGNGGGALGLDESLSNLYFTNPYSTTVTRIPITNCVPQPAAATKTGGGLGALSYYYNPQAVTADFLGNVFISTNGTCCVTGNYYLAEELTNGTGVILLSNTANAITSIAIDLKQNLYFVSNNIVYQLAYSGTAYGTTPTIYGTGYTKATAVSVDALGNLYVVDQGSASIPSTIYEIPYETSGTATAPTLSLNLADRFVVATGLNIGTAVVADPSGNLYFSQASGGTAVQELTLGSANLRSLAVGQTATATLNFQFNATTTPASIKAPSAPFGNTATTCVPGTAYAPPNSCTVSVSFAPTSVGTLSSAVTLLDSTGKPLSTGYVTGVGSGAAINLDPGTVATLGSGLKMPTGIAVDAAGNTYIADAGNNTVTLIPAGGGASTALGTSLKAPTGVAVDPAGNVFIADSGNNQVVEVPVVGGALSNAGQIVVASGLKNPGGLSMDGAGNLYVADTGDNIVLLLPNHGGTFAAPLRKGTNLNAPLSARVDPSGNLYIADSGNNQIVEIAAGSTQKLVAVGLSGPSSLAVDASGSLFVADKGNNRILRIPNEAGNLSSNDAVEAGIGIAAPYGVALDTTGKLYVTDSTNAAAYTIARTQVTLPFGQTVMGTSSGILSAAVESSGNQPLTLNTPFYTTSGNAADFPIQASGCASGITLQPGINCEFAASFVPTATGARSATFALATNAVSALPPQITATGTGMQLTATSARLALTSPASGTPFFGQPLTLTATITPASGTASPSGYVTFSVDGIVTAQSKLTAGVATLILSNGLSGGTHSVTANYGGDTTFNGSAAAALSITVTKAPTAATLTMVTPFNNPFSTTIGVPVSSPPACNNPAGIPTPAISFTATVTSVGVGIPTGAMQFLSDGVVIGTAPVFPVAGGAFAATFAPPVASIPTLLPPGTTAGEDGVYQKTHIITAVYVGDVNYITSGSVSIPLVVLAPGPTTPTTPATCVTNITAANPKPTNPVGPPVPINPASFTIAANSTSITSTHNNPGSVTLTLSSLGGWSGVIDFTCSGLPAYAQCKTLQGQPTLTASTAAGIIVPTQVIFSVVTDVQPTTPTATGFFWFAGALMGLVLLLARRRSAPSMTARLLGLVGFALLTGASIGALSGCSSGINTVSTPKGASVITVTAQGAQLTAPAATTTQTPDTPVTFTLNLTVN